VDPLQACRDLCRRDLSLTAELVPHYPNAPGKVEVFEREQVRHRGFRLGEVDSLIAEQAGQPTDRWLAGVAQDGECQVRQIDGGALLCSAAARPRQTRQVGLDRLREALVQREFGRGLWEG
jgi:hypothetical protein